MKFEKVLTITLKSQASHSARHRRGARPVRGEVTDTAERGDDPEGTVRHGRGPQPRCPVESCRQSPEVSNTRWNPEMW